MAAFHVDHVFQKLAPLGSAEDLIVALAQGIRLNGVEASTHLGVAGGLFYTEDGLQIVLLGDPSTMLGGSDP